ncbi:MAG: class I SAM-dependent methyltransferase [Bifidobacteriaceae bacterium]|nr:class I SAM-dependent methyltransferase [Bifidobacteriaceae bacterium]
MLGDATSLPFGDCVFDKVTISFGLRNVNNVHAVLAELFRVAKPGGVLVVCEFSQPWPQRV